MAAPLAPNPVQRAQGAQQPEVDGDQRGYREGCNQRSGHTFDDHPWSPPTCIATVYCAHGNYIVTRCNLPLERLTPATVATAQAVKAIQNEARAMQRKAVRWRWLARLEVAVEYMPSG